MASTNDVSTDSSAPHRRSEDEPLLGSAGDASQQRGKPIYYNFILGTGVVAQAGIWILAGIVWGAVAMQDWIFFLYHPIFNMAGIVLIYQAVLVLQPTHTAKQKTTGTYIHSAMNNLGLAAFVAGLVIIEINKGGSHHFQSTHAILGLITYCVLALQVLVGGTMFFLPSVYGGEARAKSIWKYHRMSGYIVLTLTLATVCAATQTTFNVNLLHIRLWAVLVTSILILAGILPRIKKQKLGL